MILQPHHHEFGETLANLPFFHNQMAKETCEPMHVIQRHLNFAPEIATAKEVREYLLGGEADEIVEFVDAYADDNVVEKSDYLLDWELADEWLGSI
jgi:hypothetical protein